MFKPIAPIERTFVLRTHEETGSTGFAPVGLAHADPGVGMTVAHDVLEHLDDDGSPAGEFRAFGVMYWGRAVGGYWHNKKYPLADPSPANQMTHELAEILQIYKDNPEPLTSPPKWGSRLRNDPEIDAELREIARRNFSNFYDDQDLSVEEEATRFPVDYPRMALENLRAGYRTAERKFGPAGIIPGELTQVFNEIEEAVDALLKTHSDGAYVDDLTIRVRVWQDDRLTVRNEVTHWFKSEDESYFEEEDE